LTTISDFFGCTQNAQIKNIKVEIANEIKGNNYVGGIAGIFL
jgi:hypothetical protein